MFGRQSIKTRAADYVITFARIMSSKLLGASNNVAVLLRGVETNGEDAEASDGNTEQAEESMFGSLGVVSRPKPAVDPKDATGLNPEGYTETMSARMGDSLQPISYRDLRLNAKVNPKPGQVYFVQYGGGFLSLDDASDGRGTAITLYAPHLNADGSVEKANALFMDPANAAIGLVQQNGAAITLDDNGVVLRTVGGTFFELNDEQQKFSAGNLFFNSGTFMAYCPDTTGARASALSMDADGITLLHSSGSSILINELGVIVMKSALGNCIATLDDDGLFVNGNVKVQGSLLVGTGPGGQVAFAPTLQMIIPVPVPSAFSALHGLFGMSGIASSNVFIYA